MSDTSSVKNDFFQLFPSMLLEKEIERDSQSIGKYPCTVSEKVHGSNFSLLFWPSPSNEGESFVYATRNCVLNSSKGFMNYKSFFTKKFEESFVGAAKTCKVWPSNNFQHMQVIGELYPTQQSGIAYDVEHGVAKWVVFHIQYTNLDRQIVHFTWADILLFCAHMNIDTVPEIKEMSGKTVADVWANFDTAFDSRLSTKKDNECEGIVIRVESSHFDDVVDDWIVEEEEKDDEEQGARKKRSAVVFKMVEARRQNGPLFIKKRNAGFLELCHLPAPKAAKPVDEILERMKSLCVAQRFDNVLSKFDRTDGEAIKKIINETMADIKQDYAREFDTDSDVDFCKREKTLQKFVTSQIHKFLHNKRN